MTTKTSYRLRCPECRSTRLTKDGVQLSGRKRRQRWVCHHCLRRTIYPHKDGRWPS